MWRLDVLESIFCKNKCQTHTTMNIFSLAHVQNQYFVKNLVKEHSSMPCMYVLCTYYPHGAPYLSLDENAVVYIGVHKRSPKFPASETDSRVIDPVKQPLGLPVIQPNPKLIIGFCRHG